MQDKLTAGPSQPYGIWFYSKTSILCSTLAENFLMLALEMSDIIFRKLLEGIKLIIRQFMNSKS